MKKLFFLILFFLFAACGNDSEITPDYGSPPLLSNLVYSPTSAVLNEGGGEVVILGRVYQDDADSDIRRMTTRVYNSNGDIVYSDTAPGSSWFVGDVNIVVFIDTTISDTYTFEIFVTDFWGHNSNSVGADFTVYP